MDLIFDDIFVHVKLVPPASTTLLARPAAKPMKIDGSLAESAGVPATHIAGNRHATMENKPRSAPGYAASIRTCRDKDNLYFAFEVTEPTVDEGDWFPEIIELFIDGRKDTSRAGNVWQRTKGLTQFAFHRDFSGKAGPTNAKAMVNGDKTQGENVRAAATRTDTGYIMEVAIPIANFKQVTLGEGSELPIDWALSFTDQRFNLDWMGLMGRTARTSGYGTLILAPAGK